MAAPGRRIRTRKSNTEISTVRHRIRHRYSTSLKTAAEIPLLSREGSECKPDRAQPSRKRTGGTSRNGAPGVVPERPCQQVPLRNHPSRDPLRDPAALLTEEGRFCSRFQTGPLPKSGPGRASQGLQARTAVSKQTESGGKYEIWNGK